MPAMAEMGVEHMKRKRPFGVTIIAIAIALSGPSMGLSVVLDFLRLHISVDGYRLDVTTFAASLLALALAVGLWQLRPWAWSAVMLWTGAALAGALLAYHSGHPDYAVMVEGMIIVFYLNQQDVQHAFGHGLPSARKTE